MVVPSFNLIGVFAIVNLKELEAYRAATTGHRALWAAIGGIATFERSGDWFVLLCSGHMARTDFRSHAATASVGTQLKMSFVVSLSYATEDYSPSILYGTKVPLVGTHVIRCVRMCGD